MRLIGSMLFCLLAVGSAVAQDEDIAETEKWYQLEETVFAYGLGAEQAVGEAAQCMAADNARWRTAMEQTCLDDACRETALRERIATLHGLQAGAQQVSGMELPAVPELVDVIAPEDDEAQTPKDFAAAPDFSGTGTLAQEFDDAEHMGLVLRADDGGNHVLVSLMELGNQVSHGVLLSLAEQWPAQRYIVHGGAAPAGDGIANFRSDQCRFVYRLPG